MLLSSGKLTLAFAAVSLALVGAERAQAQYPPTVAVKSRILGPKMPPFTFEIVVALIVLLAVFYFWRRRK